MKPILNSSGSTETESAVCASSGTYQSPSECQREELKVDTQKNIWQCFENYVGGTLTTGTSDTCVSNYKANSAVDYEAIDSARKRRKSKQAFYSKNG